MEQLKEYVKEQIEKYPQFKEKIQDSFQLCLDEIEAGESATHEVELCINHIDQIVNG